MPVNTMRRIPGVRGRDGEGSRSLVGEPGRRSAQGVRLARDLRR